MAKLVLNNVAAGFAATTLINANNDAIEVAMENTLSRNGITPNTMLAPLDMNGNLILNQANPISVSGFNWEGPWITATSYQVGDVVENNNSSYIAIVAHISGVFATDLAASKWQIVASSAALPTQTGHNGDILTTNGTVASWGDVNSLALPITGGTLTGPLIGTTADFTGLITPAATIGIKGTMAMNDAQVGSIGESIEAFIAEGSATPLVTATAKTITSIILTAGDWEISGVSRVLGTSTTNLTQFKGGSSSTTNIIEDPSSFQWISAPLVVGAAFNIGFAIPTRRVSIGVTTTFYLIAFCVFSASTASGWGRLSARRMR